MSRAIGRDLERDVRQRAGHRCEYCHLPEACASLPHQIDHVIPQQHHGPTAAENLALSCGPCNRHKGPNLSGVDPQTGKSIPLFNPRIHKWREHFRWQGQILIGLTEVGRGTVDVLAINHPVYASRRSALMESGQFPRDFE
jgi:hypothetical protein